MHRVALVRLRRALGACKAARLSKERAHLDDWCKEIAHSNELRKWYGHDPDRYAEFARRYRAELRDPESCRRAHPSSRVGRSRRAHLLSATKRSDISEAAVLADLLGKP